MPVFDPGAFVENVLSWRPRWWRYLRARIEFARARRRAEAVGDVGRCRVCGCTDDRACEGGCQWVHDPEELGELCSACEPAVVDKLIDRFLEKVRRG